MSIVTVAIIIVAAALGGVVHWAAGRGGAGASLAFALGLLVALLVVAAGPTVLQM